MSSRFSRSAIFLFGHPFRLTITVILLIVIGYGCWIAGVSLWLKNQKSSIHQLLNEFDLTGARKKIDLSLRLRPHDTELLLLAAQTARRDGDIESARTYLYRLTPAVRNQNQFAILERSLLEAQAGRVVEVLPSLIEALDIRHPQSEQILESLTMAFVQTYQLERASFWGQELLERSPKNAIGRLIKAQTTDTRGEREEAVEELRSIVTDFPKYYKARTSLADIYAKSQRYREAIAEYTVLFEQRPGEWGPLLGLASSFERLGQVDEARPLIKLLEERHSDNSEALLECARFAMNENRPEDAERLLQKALKITPFDHEVHRELGICLGRLDRIEESKKHMEQSKKIEADLILLEKTLAEMSKVPNDPKPRREAGMICMRNGQFSEALRWLSGALELAPKDRVTHQLLAEYYASQGDKDRALYHQLESNSGK